MVYSGDTVAVLFTVQHWLYYVLRAVFILVQYGNKNYRRNKIKNRVSVFLNPKYVEVAFKKCKCKIQ